MGDKWRQAGDKCAIIRTRAGRQLGEKQGVVGDSYKTSERLEHSERQLQVANKWRQVGDKPEITWSENRERSGRQTGRQVQNHAGKENWETRGDKWRQVETGVKSRGQTIEGVVGDHGGQVGHICEITRTRASRAYWETSANKWETNVKSRGQGI